MGLSLEELEQQATECLPARDVMSSLGGSGASGLVPAEVAALLPGQVTQLTDGVTATVPALPAVPAMPDAADVATLPALPAVPALPGVPSVGVPAL